MSDPNPYSSPAADLELASLDGEELAGRGARLGAYVIDVLILGVVGAIAGAVLALLPFTAGLFSGLDFSDPAATIPLSTTFVLTAVYLGIYLLINGSLLASEGQTVGKKMLGIRAVDAETGELMPMSRVFGLRFALFAAASQIPYVGYLWLVNVLFIFGDERRCVHDLIAKSKVVVVRK
ncbi:MAG: RDD family protein [Pseudomonadaceae bacterium]|nr:RDD family protein [Pseudomonadaceae bacterium]